MANTWFITGATRGLGKAIAQAALAAGHNVVATGRDKTGVEAALGSSDRLLALALDVTQPAQANAAAEAAVQRFGAIDVLVNNAGYGLVGALEEYSDAELVSQFNTNVFGVAYVTRAVLP
ncbi:MAG TPA: SDR family NAD(P)-dependent oxidoreductase, partial [Duganella sp.]|nr:SDR family NAD(P)-dependent oxidoreductase [Duganella sp.]